MVISYTSWTDGTLAKSGSGYESSANRIANLCQGIEYTPIMHKDVEQIGLIRSTRLLLASLCESFSLGYRHEDLVSVENPSTTT